MDAPQQRRGLAWWASLPPRSLLQSYLGTPAGVHKVQLTQVRITGIPLLVCHANEAAAKRSPRLPANAAAIPQLPVSP